MSVGAIIFIIGVWAGFIYAVLKKPNDPSGGCCP